MLKKYPRDPKLIASPTDKNAAFLRWVAKADEEASKRRLAEESLKERASQARSSKHDAKVARGEVVTLTREQKAKEEASKAGYWSGGAAICVALFYELCKASEQWRAIGVECTGRTICNVGDRRVRVVVSAIEHRECTRGIGDLHRLGLSRECGLLDSNQRTPTLGPHRSDGDIFDHLLFIRDRRVGRYFGRDIAQIAQLRTQIVTD